MAARGDGERRALSALEQRQLSAAYLLLLPLAELHQLPQHVLGDASTFDRAARCDQPLLADTPSGPLAGQVDLTGEPVCLPLQDVPQGDPLATWQH